MPPRGRRHGSREPRGLDVRIPARSRMLKRRSKARASMLAAVCLILLAWPVVQVGATGDVVGTGQFAHDHADLFALDSSLEYAVLNTGSQRLVLNGVDPDSIVPGTRLRVRGRQVGTQLFLSSETGSAVTTLSTPTLTATATATQSM